MEAIRQFIEVKDNSFNVVLPKDFTAKTVEVIIMPSPEDSSIPEWHKKVIDQRLKQYKENPDDVTDFDSFFDELKQELS
jgi:hypothetical protein